MSSAKRTRTGIVVRDHNDKTIVVAYSWYRQHRLYKRTKRRITKFVAHDERNEASIGDRVLIEEHRPMSRTKRWRLARVIAKIDVVAQSETPDQLDQSDVQILDEPSGEAK